jgi:hypothetical protein
MVVEERRPASDTMDEPGGGDLRIGAAIRNTDLAADRTIKRRYPVLTQALVPGPSDPSLGFTALTPQARPTLSGLVQDLTPINSFVDAKPAVP